MQMKLSVLSEIQREGWNGRGIDRVTGVKLKYKVEKNNWDNGTLRYH